MISKLLSFSFLLFPTSLLSAVVFLLIATTSVPAFADIVLPKIFCDHMVIQRNSKVPVWGKAKPGQALSVMFGNAHHQAVADHEGNWEITLSTKDAGGPFQIEIKANASDATVLVTDVMVGDVWLCSGQSNMEWPVSKALNATAEIEQAKDFPALRFFTVEHSVAAKPLAEFERTRPWQVCSPDSVADFSAVAYSFGRELENKLRDVPIGLIDSTWRGTPCEAWASMATLESKDSLKPLLEYWKQSGQPNSQRRPAVLFNGMIAPLQRFPVRGVIWYQGESNVGRGKQYATLFPALIADWRLHFSQPELPFLFVQLPPFRYQTETPEALPEIWDAQLKTLRTVPMTRMVTTSDVGDVQNLHPENKQEVGRRLALAALGSIYLNALPVSKRLPDYEGPIYDSMEVAGSRVRVKFNGAESGLMVREEKQELNCFQICSADGKFVPAGAKIVDGFVEVSAAEVSQPVAVRYCWEDTAVPNLVNGVGLPASPFRTDDFPLASESRDF